MKVKKSKAVNNTIKPKKNLGILVFIGILIVVITSGLFFGLKKILATESYYILLNDVPAKTQVNNTMLKEVVTSKGTSPQNAININQVKQGTVYTKIPLKSGDILSESNTGITLDTSTGIPENWVVTSFNISADDAVGGNISKGDYFDIIGVDTELGSKYLFHNVLALDLHYNEPKSTVNEQGKVIPIGETLQYIIGMPAEDAAKLHYSLVSYEDIRLVLSPNSLKYKDRNVSNLTEAFMVDNDTIPSDLFEGTDSAFTPILRDDNERPVTQEYCDEGKISPKSLCSQLPKEIKSKKRDEKDKTNTSNKIIDKEIDDSNDLDNENIDSDKKKDGSSDLDNSDDIIIEDEEKNNNIE